MIRKILIGLAITIGLASIALNILFFSQIKAILKPLEHDANRAVLVSRFFGFGDSNIVDDSIIIQITKAQDENKYLEIVDSTIYKLSMLQDELVAVSGGIDPETGNLINPGSTHYAHSYFFGENNFRSYGIDYFNEILFDYLSNVERLKIPSIIPSRVELHKKYNGGTFFDNISVAESINFIELLKANIIIDKYIYLSVRK